MNRRGSVLIFLLLITGVISFFLMNSIYYAKLNQEICYNYSNKLLFSNDFKKLTIVFSELITKSGLYNDYFEGDTLKRLQEGTNIVVDKKEYFVMIQPEAGLFDINASNEESLKNKLNEVFVDRSDINIDEIADCILDWIDPDDIKRANGAEKDDYEKFGYSPANSNLKDVFEIRKIKNIKERDFFYIIKNDNNSIEYKGLLPLFTTYKSGYTRFNVASNKKETYKNILRLYLRPANSDNVYILFLGRLKGPFELIKWKKLI